MKYPFYFGLLICSLSSFHALADEIIQGKLEVESNSKLLLKNQRGQSIKISSGPTLLEFEPKGWFLPSHFKLTSKKGSFAFRVPLASYVSNNRVENLEPAENGQAYSLKGGQEELSLLHKTLRTGTATCKKRGFCGRFKTNDKNEYVWKVSYHSDCDSEQDVIYEDNVYERKFILTLLSPSDQKVVATFSGNGEPRKETKINKYTSACGEGEGKNGFLKEIAYGFEAVKSAIPDLIGERSRKAPEKDVRISNLRGSKQLDPGGILLPKIEKTQAIKAD